MGTGRARPLTLPGLALGAALVLTGLLPALGAPAEAPKAPAEAPKVVIFVAEQAYGARRAWAWWVERASPSGTGSESAPQGGSATLGGGAREVVELDLVSQKLTEALTEAGYQVLDPGVLAGRLTVPKAYRLDALTSEQAIEIARPAGADFIVVGKAYAQSAGAVPGSKMLSVSASASARMVDARTGAVVASLSASATSVHTNELRAGEEALEKAGAKLAKALAERLAKSAGK